MVKSKDLITQTFRFIFRYFCLFAQTPNAELEYSIDPNNDLANRFFAIGRQNGQLSIIQPLTNDIDITETYTVRFVWIRCFIKSVMK